MQTVSLRSAVDLLDAGQARGRYQVPWPITVLLALCAAVLVVKAVVDRKARYDEPMNNWGGRFDHMMDPTARRDRDLQDRAR